MAQLLRPPLVTALTLTVLGLVAVQACEDGWNRTGICVSLRSCTAIFQLVRNKPSKEDISRVKKSLCQTGRRGVFVCCTPPTTSTSTTTTTQSPLDLSQFDPNTPEGNPKRRLLPHWPKCGSITSSERIVGGEEAEIGEFPWLALLGYKVEDTYSYYDYYNEGEESAAPDNIKFACGGTLINERYVVTAAHCIPKPGQGPIVTIRLGEHDLATEKDCRGSTPEDQTPICNEPPVDIEPERIIAHRQYDKPIRKKNDIALIRLSKPVNFTRWVSPICLPFEAWRTKKLPKDESIVAGFGLTQAFGDTSKTLQKLTVPMVNRSSCRLEYAKLRANIGRGQLCAGGNIGQDSCEGDSGGPLVMHGRFGPPFYLIGITSFGATNCGQGATPGVYTRVADYMDWILDHMTF